MAARSNATSTQPLPTGQSRSYTVGMQCCGEMSNTVWEMPNVLARVETSNTAGELSIVLGSGELPDTSGERS